MLIFLKVGLLDLRMMARHFEMGGGKRIPNVKRRAGQATCRK